MDTLYAKICMRLFVCVLCMCPAICMDMLYATFCMCSGMCCTVFVCVSEKVGFFTTIK
jgi:hypothetical protein